MTKFSLYYGVERDSGKLCTLGLSDRGSLGEFKAQCKKDISDPKIANKYSFLVLASDYGIVNRYKLTKIAEAPKVAKKKEGK